MGLRPHSSPSPLLFLLSAAAAGANGSFAASAELYPQEKGAAAGGRGAGLAKPVKKVSGVSGAQARGTRSCCPQADVALGPRRR